eukprot:COSAG01_NODE_4967_length_4584_cov_12.666890_7_plen_63_part_00
MTEYNLAPATIYFMDVPLCARKIRSYDHQYDLCDHHGDMAHRSSKCYCLIGPTVLYVAWQDN